MPFLDHLDDTTRSRLEAASGVISLEAGAYLVRVGDPGGDIYVVEEGILEVVEARPGGEVVLAELAPGDIVGELAFLDDSPRSADVRCRIATRARRWTREDLRTLLTNDRAVAASVYEGLSRTVAARLRNMAKNRAQERPPHDWSDDARAWRDAVEAAGETFKSRMEAAHLRIRRNPDDPSGPDGVRQALDALCGALRALHPQRPDADNVAEAMRRLRREVRPWISGSWLAMRLIDAPDTAVVQGDVFDHVLQGQPRGEGAIGVHVERWLMSTASMVARRDTERALVGRLAALMPRRVVWLDVPAPGRMERVGRALRDSPATLLVVDGSRTALAEAHAALERMGVPRVATVQETTLRLALGRSDEFLPRQDVVFLGGLLAYLPDRLAVPVLSFSRSLLRAGGHVLLSVPAESADDDAMWSDLFRWPVVRRSAPRLDRLFARAGLESAGRVGGDGPGSGLLLRATAQAAPAEGAA